MLAFFFFLGILLWTLLEYILHRFLGHVHKGRNFFKKEHLQHHAKANYFAPGYKKALVAIMVSTILFGAISLLAAYAHAGAFVFGLLSMYGLYEITHYRFHSKNPIAKPFIILRKHHFYHHFHNPMCNHGVTSRFWDRVFGTFHRVEKVRIPRRMSMQWLVNEGEIKSIYHAHFQFTS